MEYLWKHWNRTCILHISLIIIIICTGFLNVLLFWENNVALIIQFCEMFVFCEQNDYHRVLDVIFYLCFVGSIGSNIRSSMICLLGALIMEVV